MELPFIRTQGRRREHVVAFDLGGNATKAVHLQRSGDLVSLVNYAVVEAPASDKDKPLTPEALTEHMRKVVKALNGTKTRQVVVALGVGEVLFRQIEAPLMPLSDLRQMLKLNSKNYLQQDLPDHVFDCYFSLSRKLNKTLEKPGGKANESSKASLSTAKCKVLVGGIRRQMLTELTNAVKAAGLTTDQIMPGAVGPVNAFELAEPAVFGGQVAALVDIGFRNTSITILDEGEIMLHRVVNIGGDRLTAGLAEAMGISYVEAENIKIGLPTEVQAHLEPLVQPLGRELRASVDFFEHQEDKTLGQVFLSGGSARNEFLLQTLQNQLMVPCKTWSPIKGLQMALPPQKAVEVEQIAPQLAVAVGAAAAGL
jgi:type IV pilus assembly protein PilM